MVFLIRFSNGTGKGRRFIPNGGKGEKGIYANGSTKSAPMKRLPHFREDDKLMVEVGNGFHDLCGVRDLAILLTNRWSSRREPTDVRRLQAHLGVGSKTRM